jgi:hypothetical protein
MVIHLILHLSSLFALDLEGVEEMLLLVFYVSELGVFVHDFRYLEPILDFYLGLHLLLRAFSSISFIEGFGW